MLVVVMVEYSVVYLDLKWVAKMVVMWETRMAACSVAMTAASLAGN